MGHGRDGATAADDTEGCAREKRERRAVQEADDHPSSQQRPEAGGRLSLADGESDVAEVCSTTDGAGRGKLEDAPS